MRVTDEVMELAALLNEAGFGFLAGELLGEISLGLDVEDDDNPVKQPSSLADADGAVFDDEVVREAIPENDQLAFALKFLELKLVEPVRRIAEAEVMAGRLATPDEPEGKPRLLGVLGDAVSAEDAPEPVKIVFLPPGDRKGARLERIEAVGSSRAAEILSRVLRELFVAAV